MSVRSGIIEREIQNRILKRNVLFLRQTLLYKKGSEYRWTVTQFELFISIIFIAPIILGFSSADTPSQLPCLLTRGQGAEYESSSLRPSDTCERDGQGAIRTCKGEQERDEQFVEGFCRSASSHEWIPCLFMYKMHSTNSPSFQWKLRGFPVKLTKSQLMRSFQTMIGIRKSCVL